MNRTAIAAALAAALLLPAAAKADDAPGVFKIPGTESTIKLYGYVQLDATEDLSGRVGDIENNDWATVLPAVPSKDSPEGKRKKGQFYMTARTSRFGIQTNTPSAMGNVGLKLEGDFNGPNDWQSETFTNSVLFRLRHAYGTIGNLLVGQTWTTFLDFGAAPDTVDFNGPGTLALVRNPMIRYTIPFGDGMSLALAAENARGAQFGGAKYQTLPDLHANFSMGGSWGSFSARAVTQQYNVATGADTASKTAFSVAGAVSGSVKLGGDTLLAQVAGGPGIGRYLLNSLGAAAGLSPAQGGIGGNPGGIVIKPDGSLKPVTVFGYHAAYTHLWGPEFRSSVVFAQTMIQNPKVSNIPNGAGMEKTLTQAFANLFWTTSKTTEFGIEYAYGQWTAFDTSEKGVQNRINASMHYNFF